MATAKTKDSPTAAVKPRLTVITGNLKKLDEIVSIVGLDLPFEVSNELMK